MRWRPPLLWKWIFSRSHAPGAPGAAPRRARALHSQIVGNQQLWTNSQQGVRPSDLHQDETTRQPRHDAIWRHPRRINHVQFNERQIQDVIHLHFSFKQQKFLGTGALSVPRIADPQGPRWPVPFPERIRLNRKAKSFRRRFLQEFTVCFLYRNQIDWKRLKTHVKAHGYSIQFHLINIKGFKSQENGFHFIRWNQINWWLIV